MIMIQPPQGGEGFSGDDGRLGEWEFLWIMELFDQFDNRLNG